MRWTPGCAYIDTDVYRGVVFQSMTLEYQQRYVEIQRVFESVLSVKTFDEIGENYGNVRSSQEVTWKECESDWFTGSSTSILL